jgi:ATP-binding cassette subfamily B protein
LISLAYFPMIALLMIRFGSTTERKYLEVQDQFGVLSNRVQENISGIRAIKAYAQEDSEAETFAWPLMILAAGASTALVLWFGGRDVVAGRLTIGEFVQFNAYLAILSSALMPLGWTVSMAQQGIASMRRVAEVLAAHPSITDAEQPVTIERPKLRLLRR